MARPVLSRIVNRAPVPASAGLPALSALTPPRRSQTLSAFTSVGTLFAIVTATSSAVAATQWKIKRSSTNGEDVEIQHAALDMLNRPNDFCTREQFFEAVQQHLDLTGEGWIVVSRSKMGRVPLDMWYVRPDRMEPVPSETEFISGYVYRAPNGDKIPFGVDEVIFIRTPNPMDPYRGIGPVQSILTELKSTQAVAEYNLAFFENSAEPGGIIQTDTTLTEEEFKTLQRRWSDQHKGVSRAHRVGILERAQWVERKNTQRDMQFVELRQLSRDLIREAFGIPKFALGDIDDVNRATAEAASAWFGSHLTLPRLRRWQGALNSQLLPMFGDPAGAYFDFESPVTEDEEQERLERDSRVSNAVALIGTGKFDPTSVIEAFELPELKIVETPDPPPIPPVPPIPPQDARLEINIRDYISDEPEGMPDIEHVQESWESALAELLRAWSDIETEWTDELLSTIRAIVESGDLLALAALSVRWQRAAELIESAMMEVGTEAGRGVVREAAAQGVEVQAQRPRRSDIAVTAQIVAQHMATEYALSAAREAARVTGPASTAADVIPAVRTHLAALTDARPAQYLGHALTSAQHEGRIATFRAAPEAAYYASEQLDRNTCSPCKKVHGKWLGNDLFRDVPLTYPTGGYVDCEGRSRCRGQVVAIWRPRQVGDE